MPSKPKFVSLEEFSEMIAISGVLTLNIANKDLGKYYNLSKETEIDEIDSDKHMQMFKLEFLEAIARVADKIDYNRHRSIEYNNGFGGSEENQSRRNTEGPDILKNIRDAINIEGEHDVLQSESNSSSISDIINSQDDINLAKVSTIVRNKDFKVRITNNLENIEDTSSYSLGDVEKLYQKLERFIKTLIENCFRNNIKRMSTKKSIQIFSKPNAYLVEGENQNAARPSTPKKRMTMSNTKYIFKRAFTKKILTKKTVSESNLLQVRKV